MHKKTVQQKVVYRTSPFILFLAFILCIVSLFVVIHEQNIIDDLALTYQIDMLQRTSVQIPMTTITPTPEKQMNLGY